MVGGRERVGQGLGSAIADGLHGVENALDSGDLLLRQRRREDPRVRPQGIEEV